MQWAKRILGSEFARQLAVLFAASLFVLAFTSAMLTSVLLNHQLQRWAQATLIQLTGQFADQGVSALLVDDAVGAQHTLRALSAFPGVRTAALLTPDLRLRWSEGQPLNWSLADHPGAWREAPAWAGEDADHWYFAAPVQTRPQYPPTALREEPATRLGYVYLAWDKRPLRTLSLVIFVVNGGITLLIAVLAMLSLRRQLRRLSTPLHELAEVMRGAQDTQPPVRATVRGPAEVRDIATVFNRLMNQIEQHRASLEAEVTIRTLELREARDAALRAAQHKTEFTALITHDMRTLLHALGGYQQLALEELSLISGGDGADTAMLKECLDHAHDAAQELSGRLQDILKLARLEAGKAEIHRQITNMEHLVAQVLTLVRPHAAQRKNQLSVSVAGKQNILTDRDKVFHILLNLMTNACQFTECGQITLAINCCEDKLIMEVADTGCGIPLQQQARIFEPFQQVVGSHFARTGTGTGLGLAITQRFCELLGGTVQLHSQVGKGSTFQVQIPHPANDALNKQGCRRVDEA